MWFYIFMDLQTKEYNRDNNSLNNQVYITF